MERSRQFRSIGLLVVMLVMMAHHSIPHIHSHESAETHHYHSDPLLQQYAHVHAEKHTHGKSTHHHDHQHPQDRTIVPASNSAENSGLLDQFLKGHLHADHSHFYTTTLFKKVRRVTITLPFTAYAAIETTTVSAARQLSSPAFSSGIPYRSYPLLKSIPLRAPPA